MKFIEVPQGTPDWMLARVGRITASCFADAVSTVGGLTEQQEKYVHAVMRGGATEKEAIAFAGYKAAPTAECVKRALAGERTEEFSDTAKRYAADLSLERISRQPHGEPVKTWVLERGHTMEAAARRIYEGRTGAFVTEAGICLTDDDLFGYSTDGLVDDDGLIEIKAPIDSIKIMEMWKTGDTSEYDHQMQGGMWITGRQWCDFIMYVPDLAPVGKDLFVKRVMRDDAFIDKMVAQLVEFEQLVSANEAVWREGYVPPAPAAVDDSDVVDATFDPDFQEVTAAPAAQPAPFDASTTGSSEASMAERPLGVLAPAAGWPFPTERPPAPAPAATMPPTLRLGVISERLGFALTADFLRGLGFEPAARDKTACLYHEHDFVHICAALHRHISAVCEKQAA